MQLRGLSDGSIHSNHHSNNRKPGKIPVTINNLNIHDNDDYEHKIPNFSIEMSSKCILMPILS